MSQNRMMRVWQIAAGQTGRFYDDLFRKHDVMFMGPATYGPYQPDLYRRLAEKGIETGNQITQVRKFCSEAKAGDVVLLRKRLEVIAIGTIADEPYSWDESFDDVYGWALQHRQRVVWQHQLGEELRGIQGSRPLFHGRKQIPTFTGVKHAQVLDRVQHLFTKCERRPLKPLPQSLPKPLSLESLSEALFARGLSYDSVSKVRKAIEKQRRLVRWYCESGLSGGRPTEHEVVAHIILPIMLGLGWSEQLLAVEWRKIDLAAFRATPTDERTCKLVVEAKEMNHGLQGVVEQAKGYARKLPECDKILVTNGIRCYMHRREGDHWGETPIHYFNLLRLREDHLCHPGTNAVDGIVALTPASVSR